MAIGGETLLAAEPGRGCHRLGLYWTFVGWQRVVHVLLEHCVTPSTVSGSIPQVVHLPEKEEAIPGPNLLGGPGWERIFCTHLCDASQTLEHIY